MSYMFESCPNLIKIDLSSFDTKNVTNMSSMFKGCSKLNVVKINNISLNLIEQLRDTFAYIFDQLGNNISKDNYLNNNNSNYFFNYSYMVGYINCEIKYNNI